MTASHLVIGTAGHVDHGKTALVRALTGTDTDRLPEEKARGISIELGFARLVLPSGREAAVVDVPGHERFIRQMVAGATGIDLVLLVVAADEGVMPQTREHLDILSLLRIRSGLVALTKSDLVDDDWLELAKEDAAAALSGTFLDGAPIVAVSSLTGAGLGRLREEIDRLLRMVPPRSSHGSARLSVDRVFSVAGFGTVVTGTLASGRVRLEDRLEIAPKGLAVRVRGLQVHGERRSEAWAGERVAVNLSGVERDEISRGSVLASPGSVAGVTAFAAELTLLPSAPRPLVSGERVHLSVGTAEALARIGLLEGELLAPGQTGLARLRTEEPVAVARFERFVVRSYSPVRTIGGGAVLEPGGRVRRSDARAMASLQALAAVAGGSVAGEPGSDGMEGGLGAAGRALLQRAGLSGLGRADLAGQLHLRPEQADALAERLLGDGAALEWEGRLLSADVMADLAQRVESWLGAYFERHPLRFRAPREELRRHLAPDTEPRWFATLLSRLADTAGASTGGDSPTEGGHAADGSTSPGHAGRWFVEGDRLGLAGRAVNLGALAPLADAILQAIRSARLVPPSLSGLVPDARAEEVLAHLIERGDLVRVAEDVVLDAVAYREARSRLVAHLEAHGTISLAELRDLLGTNRRLAQMLAEHWDSERLTRRRGDVRVLAGPPEAGSLRGIAPDEAGEARV